MGLRVQNFLEPTYEFKQLDFTEVVWVLLFFFPLLLLLLLKSMMFSCTLWIFSFYIYFSPVSLLFNEGLYKEDVKMLNLLLFINCKFAISVNIHSSIRFWNEVGRAMHGSVVDVLVGQEVPFGEGFLVTSSSCI